MDDQGTDARSRKALSEKPGFFLIDRPCTKAPRASREHLDRVAPEGARGIESAHKAPGPVHVGAELHGTSPQWQVFAARKGFPATGQLARFRAERNCRVPGLGLPASEGVEETKEPVSFDSGRDGMVLGIDVDKTQDEERRHPDGKRGGEH